MLVLSSLFLAFGAAALIAALGTSLFARFAAARGLVVVPRSDRWHRAPTPILGGAAIALAIIPVALVLAPIGLRVAVVLGCALAAFALGLLDDFRRLAPATKLVGQVLIAAALFFGGVRVELIAILPVSFILTVFWIVAMMNAVNLLDNMDGLAAGIAVIAAVFLGLAASDVNPEAAILAAVTAGAALGFLVHNFSPARAFMGDAGSLLLGFLLGTIALLHTTGSAANLTLALFGPLAILALPIFDTAFVTASRGIAGIPIGQGGRDHASHRLAALGLSDRSAVLVLWGIAILLATLGLVADAVSALIAPLFVLAAVGMVLFGIFLHDVEVYGEHRRETAVSRALGTYGRFGAEIGLDVLLLTTAYYVAWLIRFDGQPLKDWIYLFGPSVPLVVAVQLTSLVGFGVYRTLWRYLGVSDGIGIVRAIVVGTAAAALGVLLIYRFQEYSRAVFVVDAVLASVLIIGARVSLLWLRNTVTGRPASDARRVLVVGAGDNGALALRMLTRATAKRYRPVGFVDDDPGKRYRRVGGVPIVGTLDELEEVIERTAADLVILSLDDEVVAAKVRAVCAARRIECRPFLISV
ncbi:MAG: hypothetical protein HY071_03645 [Chloroflexi bacterium]|nr:hypothetical protein [Chloroflexota bacterium]